MVRIESTHTDVYASEVVTSGELAAVAYLCYVYHHLRTLQLGLDLSSCTAGAPVLVMTCLYPGTSCGYQSPNRHAMCNFWGR